jgi:hypothetical protein
VIDGDDDPRERGQPEVSRVGAREVVDVDLDACRVVVLGFDVVVTLDAGASLTLLLVREHLLDG